MDAKHIVLGLFDSEAETVSAIEALHDAKWDGGGRLQPDTQP